MAESVANLRWIFDAENYWSAAGYTYSPTQSRYSMALYYLFDQSLDWVVRKYAPEKANDLLIVK